MIRIDVCWPRSVHDLHRRHFAVIRVHWWLWSLTRWWWCVRVCVSLCAYVSVRVCVCVCSEHFSPILPALTKIYMQATALYCHARARMTHSRHAYERTNITSHTITVTIVITITNYVIPPGPPSEPVPPHTHHHLRVAFLCVQRFACCACDGWDRCLLYRDWTFPGRICVCVCVRVCLFVCLFVCAYLCVRESETMRVAGKTMDSYTLQSTTAFKYHLPPPRSHPLHRERCVWLRWWCGWV